MVYVFFRRHKKLKLSKLVDQARVGKHVKNS